MLCIKMAYLIHRFCTAAGNKDKNGKSPPDVNLTPFPKQYTILSNKWGAVHICAAVF